MDNKGFTLVEMLAVVVVLSLVMGIAGYGVMSTIQHSKEKSEGIFVARVSDLIQEYLALKGSSLDMNGLEYHFDKCSDGKCRSVKATQLTSIHLQDLIIERLVDEDAFVNPTNKKKCLDGKNPEVLVYKDDDYVYYYYVNLNGDNTSCEIGSNNAIINTLPASLRQKVGLS